jgi:hypothetical protein
MDDEKKSPDGEPKNVRLIETPIGEEVALGMKAQLREGMSAAGQKEMSGPQGSTQDKHPKDPPPKPPDAHQSATPKDS